MQALPEKIFPNQGSSFAYRVFEYPNHCVNSYWHLHPEYELVYIQQGKGKRQVGQHFSEFADGELIFLGPELPHLAFSETDAAQNLEIVIQLKADFLGDAFWLAPEFAAVRTLLQRSEQGITFGTAVKKEIGQCLELMQTQNPMQRLLSLLEILDSLAQTDDFQLLNARSPSLQVQASDYHRINRVYEYVEANFQEPIRLEAVAEQLHMTETAFCRLFKKVTSKTFVQYLNEYRIAHACRLLEEGKRSITEVAYASGFSHISHFNRLFKRTQHETPRDYMNRFVAMMH
ncbi:MAG: helix-turn-helix domain-containing protein [Bacteroidia bacterium]